MGQRKQTVQSGDKNKMPDQKSGNLLKFEAKYANI